jgi:hypothetical protein
VQVRSKKDLSVNEYALNRSEKAARDDAGGFSAKLPSYKTSKPAAALAALFPFHEQNIVL